MTDHDWPDQSRRANPADAANDWRRTFPEVTVDPNIPDNEVHLVSGDSRTVIRVGPAEPKPDTERVLFGVTEAVTGLELTGHMPPGEQLHRIVGRLERQLGDAVEERGGLFSEMRVRYEIRATYTATVPREGSQP